MSEPKACTVAQLIEALKTLPPDAPCFVGYDCFYKQPVLIEDVGMRPAQYGDDQDYAIVGCAC